MKRLLFLATVVLTLLIIAAPLAAQGPNIESEAGRVALGSNLTLEEGEQIDGDVVVFGGNFSMEAGSEVKGSVVVFGGNIKIEGEVTEDVAAIGGNVSIKDSAVIKGDVVSVGGNVTVAENARVDGTVANGMEFNFDGNDFSFEAPEFPAPPVQPEIPEIGNIETGHDSGSSLFSGVARFIGDGIQNIFGAFIIAGLSVLVILFFPSHMKVVEDTVNKAAPTSFIIGLITLPAVAVLITLLAIFFWLIIPICGILIVAVAFAIAMLTGWAVIGKLVGARIFAAFENPTANNISTTLLGVGVLTLLVYMPFVDKLPFIGWMFSLVGVLVWLLVSATGLGAVVLTRFGTQAYQGSPSLALNPASASPPAEQDPPADETEA